MRTQKLASAYLGAGSEESVMLERALATLPPSSRRDALYAKLAEGRYPQAYAQYTGGIRIPTCCFLSDYTPASAYVNIRQHTSADAPLPRISVILMRSRADIC